VKWGEINGNESCTVKSYENNGQGGGYTLSRGTDIDCDGQADDNCYLEEFDACGRLTFQSISWQCEEQVTQCKTYTYRGMQVETESQDGNCDGLGDLCVSYTFNDYGDVRQCFADVGCGRLMELCYEIEYTCE